MYKSKWPTYQQEEIDAVVAVLRSGRVNYWTGDQIRLFESEFAQSIGVEHCIGLMNGTVALELALRALGEKRGDRVLVACRSYVASATSILNVGAVPVFVDVCLESGNIDSSSLRRAYTGSEKALICVHLGGTPCDMDPILEFTQLNSIKVIEDCAQAHGAKYKDKSVGSFGDVACWSFCQDKIISTGGEGGMVGTSDEALWEKMWSYKDHGKSLTCLSSERRTVGTFPFVHDFEGSNYRMTEVQAAIGRIQLRNLEVTIRQRRSNAELLFSILNQSDIFVRNFKTMWTPDKNVRSVFYRFYIRILDSVDQPEELRTRIIEALADRGIPIFVGSCSEIYREKVFASVAPRHRFRAAESLSKATIAMCVDQTISSSQIRLLGESFISVIKRLGI